MNSRFDEKVILITGAGSGLGQASALQVAKEGAKLALVDLNPASLEETKSKVLDVAPNAEVLLVTANVTDEKAVKNYVNETVKRFGKIEVSSTTQGSRENKISQKILTLMNSGK